MCISMCIYIYMYVCVRVCAYAYYIYIYIYRHTHTHTPAHATDPSVVVLISGLCSSGKFVDCFRVFGLRAAVHILFRVYGFGV